MRPQMSLEPRLDADGIYALLALRSFATSWAPLTDEVEDLGQTNLSCGSYDDMLPNTPLCSAIYVIEREIVGLLLEHRADPNGYHRDAVLRLTSAAECGWEMECEKVPLVLHYKAATHRGSHWWGGSRGENGYLKMGI